MNKELTKNTNIAKIYECVAKHQGITRSKIMKQTGLSAATLSDLSQELLAAKILLKEDSQTKRVGRKANLLYCNREIFGVLSVEITSSHIRMVLTNLCCEIVLHSERSMRAGSLSRLIEEQFKDLQREALQDWTLLGVCIIVPAVIDYAQRLIYSTILQDGMTENLIGELEQLFDGLPLCFLNDSACLAYAEAHQPHENGGNTALSSFLFLNIAEGIGGSFVYEGELFNGPSGNGTQFGHVSIDYKGQPCICGGRGCLESLIGQKALIERSAQLMPDLLEALAEEACFPAIAAAYRAGLPAAGQLISEMVYFLALGIANMLSIYKTSHIIIGGRGMALGENFLLELRERTQQSGFRYVLEKAKIHLSTLDESALFIGSHMYFMKYHMDFSALA